VGKASGLPAVTPRQLNGLQGARKRWGIPRNVRLAGLTPEQREVVIELVRELREAAQKAEDQHPGFAPEHVPPGVFVDVVDEELPG
jgi:hypothetical protein